MSPLILAIITALGPALPAIIQGVESLFGPKTGPVKLETATAAAGAITSQAATAGKLPGVPTNADLQAVVEMAVQILKSQGKLDSSTAPVAATTLTVSGTLTVTK